MLEEAERKLSVCIYAEDAFLCWESAQGSQILHPNFPTRSLCAYVQHMTSNLSLTFVEDNILNDVLDGRCLLQDGPALIHMAQGHTAKVYKYKYFYTKTI